MRFIALAVLAAATAGCAKKAEPAAEAAPAVETAAAEAPAAEESPAVELSAAEAGLYKSDAKHAYITFSYLHQGYSRPWLRWRTWSADLNWNPAAPESSTIVVTIDANSIDSGVDDFDGHLRAPDFFDTAQFSTITFASSSLTKSGPNAGTLTGDLTVKGVTKPVTLDVVINRAALDDFAQAHKLGFSAKGKIKRSDFGLGKYVPFVGDEVDLVIETEFVKPLAAATPAQ